MNADKTRVLNLILLNILKWVFVCFIAWLFQTGGNGSLLRLLSAFICGSKGFQRGSLTPTHTRQSKTKSGDFQPCITQHDAFGCSINICQFLQCCF
jgi:hypothetical protein